MVVLWDCSNRYDENIMRKMLGDLYMIYTMVVDSADYGMIGPRKRMYGVMLLKSDVLTRFSRLQDVIPMFYRIRAESLSLLE